jgi:integrase
MAHGQRQRETFATREEAEAKLLERLAEVKTGRFAGLVIEKVTVGDLIDLVIEDYEFRKLRSTPVVKWRAEANLRKAVGGLLAARFGPAEVKRYVAGRRAEAASDATINRELAIIRRGFTLGFQHDPQLVTRQPYIPILEEDNARQGFLEPEQYERLLHELPERLKALYVCAYHVGTRKGELRKVQWPQVDFEARQIKLTVGQTKGKRARTVPIYGDMETWLQRQRAGCGPDCPWVFYWHGRPVGAHLEGWAEACDRAGVPGLLFHDLRRSAVRNMKRAGNSDKSVMDISGHKTRSIFDRYDIISDADVAAVAKRTQEYLQKRLSNASGLRRVK